MKKLETGNIYSFHYRRYKTDPNPLVLILYHDKDICHALNFHYLKANLTIQLIKMIADFAIKNSKKISMYQHYHNWMKRYIPGVIKNAYRTYKPNHITSVKQVTKGNWGIESFVNYIADKEKHLTKTKVQERLSKKLRTEKTKEIEGKKININKLENYIINYVDTAEDLIRKSREKDQSIYTRVHKKG